MRDIRQRPRCGYWAGVGLGRRFSYRSPERDRVSGSLLFVAGSNLAFSDLTATSNVGWKKRGNHMERGEDRGICSHFDLQAIRQKPTRFARECAQTWRRPYPPVARSSIWIVGVCLCISCDTVSPQSLHRYVPPLHRAFHKRKYVKGTSGRFRLS